MHTRTHPHAIAHTALTHKHKQAQSHTHTPASIGTNTKHTQYTHTHTPASIGSSSGRTWPPRRPSRTRCRATPAARASAQCSPASRPQDSRTCGASAAVMMDPHHTNPACGGSSSRNSSGGHTARSLRSPPGAQTRPTRSGAAPPPPPRDDTAPPCPISCTRAHGPCAASRWGRGTWAAHSALALGPLPQPAAAAARRPTAPSTLTQRSVHRTTAAQHTLSTAMRVAASLPLPTP
jgi:hypothetical protein